jgi:hypothetical protein
MGLAVDTSLLSTVLFGAQPKFFSAKNKSYHLEFGGRKTALFEGLNTPCGM